MGRLTNYSTEDLVKELLTRPGNEVIENVGEGQEAYLGDMDIYLNGPTLLTRIHIDPKVFPKERRWVRR